MKWIVCIEPITNDLVMNIILKCAFWFCLYSQFFLEFFRLYSLFYIRISVLCFPQKMFTNQNRTTPRPYYSWQLMTAFRKHEKIICFLTQSVHQTTRKKLSQYILQVAQEYPILSREWYNEVWDLLEAKPWWCDENLQSSYLATGHDKNKNI